MQADPLAKSGPGIAGWNRYTYVGNNPVNAADPSGLRTYVLGGVIGAPDPRALILLGALPDAGVQNVYPDLVQAFGSCCHSLLSQLGESGGVLGRSVNPNSDADSVGLKNLVLQDRPNLAEGEQINFIGYNGGLTVALNAASLLEQKGVAVNNIVSIGGVAFRGKPGKVAVWCRRS